MNNPSKELIIGMLDKWVRQRPGLEPGNYISGWDDKEGRKAYFAEQRSITKDLHHYRALERAVLMADGLTADMLLDAFRAYSGRLSLKQRDDGKYELSYCTGQYWPTEYRRAACAVLAAALWDYKSEHCMPAPQKADSPTLEWSDGPLYDGLNAGTWLRQSFKRDFGRHIAERWFN